MQVLAGTHRHLKSMKTDWQEPRNKLKADFSTQPALGLGDYLPQDAVLASGLDALKKGSDKLTEEKSATA